MSLGLTVEWMVLWRSVIERGCTAWLTDTVSGRVAPNAAPATRTHKHTHANTHTHMNSAARDSARAQQFTRQKSRDVSCGLTARNFWRALEFNFFDSLGTAARRHDGTATAPPSSSSGNREVRFFLCVRGGVAFAVVFVKRSCARVFFSTSVRVSVVSRDFNPRPGCPSHFVRVHPRVRCGAELYGFSGVCLLDKRADGGREGVLCCCFSDLVIFYSVLVHTAHVHTV